MFLYFTAELLRPSIMLMIRTDEILVDQSV